jgi:hypothetical protein
MWHRGNIYLFCATAERRDYLISQKFATESRDCQIGFQPAYVTLKFDSSNFKSASVFLLASDLKGLVRNSITSGD